MDASNHRGQGQSRMWLVILVEILIDLPHLHPYTADLISAACSEGKHVSEIKGTKKKNTVNNIREGRF